MVLLRSAIKAIVYSPLSPVSVRTIGGLLRAFGWLPRAASSTSVRHILVVQAHNSLGDLVLSIPLLEEMHRLWPQAKVDVIVGDRMMGLFEQIPFVNRVIGYVPSRLRQPLARFQDTVRLALLCHRALDTPYDIALDPRWDSDPYAYLARVACFFSGATERLAYSGSVDGRDRSLDQFLTRSAVGGSHEHELLRKMRLVERTGLSDHKVQDSESLRVSAPLFNLSKTRQCEGARILRASGFEEGEPFGVLAPSASVANRMWPIESLSKVVKALSAETGLRFLAIGALSEAGRCQQLERLNPGLVRSLAGQTGVLELCSIIAESLIFIGNDSGPAHIAGMLGRNTIVVSPFPAELNGIDHMNSPRRFRPCGPRVRVLQPEHSLSPCRTFCESNGAHCVAQVSPEQVLEECMGLLQQLSR